MGKRWEFYFCVPYHSTENIVTYVAWEKQYVYKNTKQNKIVSVWDQKVRITAQTKKGSVLQLLFFFLLYIDYIQPL